MASRSITAAADVIVIGLGAMGAATLCQLASAGVRAIGIDRFHPPHGQGSSHGDTRITRLAVGEGEIYAPLVARSHQLWRDLEARTGERLFDPCGFLTVDETGGRSNLHGHGGFFERTVEIAERRGIAHEVFDGAEIARRYPAFRPARDARVCLEPGGGQVFPERCIEVQLRLALAAGAELRLGETVVEIDGAPGSVRVSTGQGRYEAGQVVVAVGAWAPALIGAPLAEMRLLRQVLHWFGPTSPQLYREPSPTFVWLHGSGPEDSFYGFPRRGGRVKIATEQYAEITASPAELDRAVRPEEGRRFFDTQLRGRVAGLPRSPDRSEVCVYTAAPEARFTIDRLRSDERILVVSACSGHGFKHSAAIGEHVSAVVRGRERLMPAFALASAEA